MQSGTVHAAVLVGVVSDVKFFLFEWIWFAIAILLVAVVFYTSLRHRTATNIEFGGMFVHTVPLQFGRSVQFVLRFSIEGAAVENLSKGYLRS